MSATIVGPKAITLPASMGGDDDVFGLVVVSATRGLTVSNAPDGQVQVTGLTDFGLVSIPIIQLLMSKGCEVHGYPVFFEFALESDLDNEVPETFPNRAYTEPDSSVEVVHTWRTWGNGPGHEPHEIDGKWYRSSQDGGNLGQPIPVSAWISAGLTVKSVPEYQALIPPM